MSAISNLYIWPHPSPGIEARCARRQVPRHVQGVRDVRVQELGFRTAGVGCRIHREEWRVERSALAGGQALAMGGAENRNRRGFGFGFRSSEFGVRISGFGFWCDQRWAALVSVFGFRGSGIGYRVSGSGVHARPFEPCPSVVLGAIVSLLGPFCGHLSPKVVNIFQNLDF